MKSRSHSHGNVAQCTVQSCHEAFANDNEFMREKKPTRQGERGWKKERERERERPRKKEKKVYLLACTLYVFRMKREREQQPGRKSAYTQIHTYKYTFYYIAANEEDLCIWTN